MPGQRRLPPAGNSSAAADGHDRRDGHAGANQHHDAITDRQPDADRHGYTDADGIPHVDANGVSDTGTAGDRHTWSSPVAKSGLILVNIRQGPGLDRPVVEATSAGRAYTIVGRDIVGGWWQICCTQNGELGWIAAALVTVQGDTSNVPIVETP